MKKAQEGDLKAIEELCSSTWESVYRFIYFKVQNRQEAEDITQETYVKALSHLRRSNIKIDKYIILQNRGITAIVEVGDSNSAVGKVYLKRLIRKDSTGIWTVVGYDPADKKQ